jgi:hypothetical protein
MPSALAAICHSLDGKEALVFVHELETHDRFKRIRGQFVGSYNSARTHFERD